MFLKARKSLEFRKESELQYAELASSLGCQNLWKLDEKALLLTRRCAWTLFVGSRQVNQLIEMSTVIRSRSGWFEREGAVFECRRQGADVQLRSSSSSSNPLVWDIE
ncbi:hypothetical protein J6590_077374 [Homalodisca vitripennis]|nr:hypothetical protein J6590_077374 [Homalodisca vitripennis]